MGYKNKLRDFLFFWFLSPLKKKKTNYKKMRVKKIKSPLFPTKSKNRFLSSDIVYFYYKKNVEKKNLDPWDILLIQYLENKPLRGRLYGCHETPKEREKAAWGTQDFNSVKGNQTK